MKTGERIKYILKCVNRAGSDPLKQFVNAMNVDELPVLRQALLQQLFDECNKHDVRYVYLGKGEICGCEKIAAKSGFRRGRPVMWTIAEDLGIQGGCGNSDQYQTSDYNTSLFPINAYGGWDLKKNVKLTDEQVEEKKFARVVTRDRNKDKQ